MSDPLAMQPAPFYIGRMSSGRFNSDRSIATASRVIRQFGGRWSEVERNSRRDDDGVNVIRLRRTDGMAGEPVKPAGT